ncbi:lipoprotein [Leptospira perolatii]|uniref:Lipoprotein n=1 Tax=Leptospira perolatii TaxID=2023191 RepID=A0A2M9ZPX2_9LEPT|nr:TIGR04452 family lipoprotein [Leptospira perolatii]PJZ69047.1 lipoprotein [Leptospira perolatii]PJZ74084.1 lipoprotein [Leptospira perolatii]
MSFFRTILNCFLLLTTFIFVQCNNLGVAGPGGIKGSDAKLQIKEAQNDASNLFVGQLFPLLINAPDCSGLGGNRTTRLSGFDAYALKDLAGKVQNAKISDTKIYTKSSIDKCTETIRTIGVSLSVQYAQDVQIYGACQNAPIPLDLATIVSYEACKIEEAGFFQFNQTSFP